MRTITKTLLILILGCVLHTTVQAQNDTVYLYFEEDTVQTGSSICVPLYVHQFDTIGGIQFSVYFDPFLLHFDSTRNSNPALQGTVNIGTNNADAGIIAYSLLAPGIVGTGVPDSTALVELCFTVNGEPGELCPLNYAPLNGAIEVIDPLLNILPYDIDKGFITITNADTIQLHLRTCTSNQDSSGSIKVRVTGGVPPYSVNYENINGDTVSGSFVLNSDTDTYTIEGLNIADYRISGTDAIGAPFTENLIIRNRGALAYDLTVDHPQCSNTTDGRIELDNFSGWWTPVFAKWPNGDLFATTREELSVGIYNVDIIDRGGCTETLAIELVPEGFDIDLVLAHETCAGQADGAAFVQATGGTPTDSIYYTYIFQMDTIIDSALILNNLAPGNYEVLILDSTGCSSSATFAIQDGRQLEVQNLMTMDPLCFGGSSGSIDIQVGYENDTITEGFQFNSSPAYPVLADNNRATFNMVMADSVVITVIDTNRTGCMVDTFALLFNPLAMEISLVNSGVESCQPGNDGFIEIAVSGGTLTDSTDYGYSWSNGDSTTLVEGLDSGIFGVTVSDDNGCTVSDSFELFNAETPVLSPIQFTDRTCFPDADGSASFSIMIGSSNIDSLVFQGPDTTIIWYNLGDTSFAITGLDTGLVSVFAVDENGCTAQAGGRVSSVDEIEITSVDLVDPTCASDMLGTIELNITPGDGAIDSVTINGANVGNELTFMRPAGSYDIVVIDDNGCIDSAMALINGITPLEIDSVFATSLNCAGDMDASAGVFVSIGSDSTLNFLWSNGEMTPNITNLGAGTYEVIISDGNLCSDSVEVTIDEPIAIEVTASSTPDTSSIGVGTVEVTASGGAGIRDINWMHLNDSINAFSLDSLMGGWYVFTVVDSNDCSVTDSVFVDNLTSTDEDFISTKFNIYPNPASSEIYLDWSHMDVIPDDIRAVNARGQVIWKPSNLTKEIPNSVDVSNWPRGLYIIEITAKGGRYYKKLMLN